MKILMLTVTYNNSDQCMAFLKSLSKNDVDKMVVVDNGSTEEEYEKLRAGMESLGKSIGNSKFFYLDKGENVGLTRAWNKVMKRFNKYDYYIIASSDIVLDKNTVKKMKEVMSRKKSEDVVLSSVLYSMTNYKKSDVLQTTGTFFNDDKKIRFSLFKMPGKSGADKEKIIQKKDIVNNKEIRCSTTAFGCIFFSKRVMKKIGLFNENFFLFNEDADFFLRLKLANIPVYLVTEAKLWHPTKSLSNSDDNDFILYNRIFSNILFYRIYRKNAEHFYLFKYFMFVFFKIFQSLFRLKFSRIAIIIKAIKNSLRQKPLPLPKFAN